METVTLSETAMPLQPGNLGRLDNLTPGCCTGKRVHFMTRLIMSAIRVPSRRGGLSVFRSMLSVDRIGLEGTVMQTVKLFAAAVALLCHRLATRDNRVNAGQPGSVSRARAERESCSPSPDLSPARRRAFVLRMVAGDGLTTPPTFTRCQALPCGWLPTSRAAGRSGAKNPRHVPPDRRERAGRAESRQVCGRSGETRCFIAGEYFTPAKCRTQREPDEHAFP